jgi:hypothetical protein
MLAPHDHTLPDYFFILGSMARPARGVCGSPLLAPAAHRLV